MQGDVPQYALAVQHGIVRVYNLTADGVEKCISYYTHHDIFPMCWLFSKADRSLYYYQAHTDCEVAIIEKELFFSELQHNIELMQDILSTQATTYVQLMMRINALEQPSASTKLLNMFQLLCLRYGTVKREHVVEIELPMTQQAIADFTGLTRETTTLELKKLRSDNIISCRRKMYRVHTNRLNERMADEFNPGIHIEKENRRNYDETNLNTTPTSRPPAWARKAHGAGARI